MNYKILFSVLSILFIFLLASGTAFAAPIEIRTLEDLMAIEGSPLNLSLDYVLMNDIDVGKEETDSLSFHPIGTGLAPFSGTFDGGGYTISNITFSDNTRNGVGLFGYVIGSSSDNAVLKNIVLKDVNIIGEDFVGGLVGFMTLSSISDSSAAANVTGISNVGGLVGYSSSCTISNSSATGDVFGDYLVGGFAGFLTNSPVSDCYAAGNVVGSSDSVGGFVGRLVKTSVSNSYATGNVAGSNDSVGGFVGFMYDCSVSDSYAAGNVKGADYAGGFVGALSQSSVSKTYAAGDVEGNKYVGGFAGVLFQRFAIVSSSGQSGGNIPPYPPTSVSNSYATGNVTGTEDLGGFVGFASNSTVSKSYAIGNAAGSGNNVSGFVGVLDDSTIADSFYIGTPNSNDTSKGLFVTSDELKQVSTFTTVGSYLTAPWNITHAEGQIAIWYILEGGTYPQHNKTWSVPQPVFTVTFDSDGGTPVQSQGISYGYLVTKPADPVKSGYTFVEWQLNGTAYNFSKLVTSHLDLVAIYTPVVVSHTVTFDSDGGTAIPSQKVNGGDLVTQPANPMKADYTFVRWELNGVAYDFSTPVAGNLTLVAVYEATSDTTYTVTFNSDGGTLFSPKTINGGDLVTQPTPNPVKAGYSFKEWQLNGVKYDFSTPVNKDFTLIAIYTAESGNSGGNGGGTGSAKIVDNTPQNNEPQNNEPQNNEPQNNEPQNNEPQNNEPQNNEPQNNTPQDNTLQNNNSTKGESSNSLIWWGLGAVLLIVLIGGIVYVFYSKKK